MAGRELFTSYQPTDPSLTRATYRKKEKKRKTVGDKKKRAAKENKKALALLLEPANPTPSNTGQ